MKTYERCSNCQKTYLVDFLVSVVVQQQSGTSDDGVPIFEKRTERWCKNCVKFSEKRSVDQFVDGKNKKVDEKNEGKVNE